MRFLADQDVYAATVQFLRGLGHDVETASERGMAQAADTELLRVAGEESRIFVTRIGITAAWCSSRNSASGACTSRVLPSTLQAVHAELGRVLGLYPENELLGAFVVIEPARHRIRRPAPDAPDASEPPT